MDEQEFRSGKRADGTPLENQATIVMVGDPRLAWLTPLGSERATIFINDGHGVPAFNLHNKALAELRDAITAHLAREKPAGWPTVAADSGAKHGEVGR